MTRFPITLPLLATVLLAACSGGSSAPSPAPSPVPPAPATAVLSVSNSGLGRIVSTPAGIDCGSQCSASFPQDSVISLSATPDSGQEFAGWSGDCTGLDPCTLMLSKDRRVAAAFRVATIVPPVAAQVCDAYAGPALSSLKSYEGLMHEHSAYSDGDPSFIPADYFRIAGEQGYSFVGSAEHSDSLDDFNFVTLHASCDPTSGQFDPTQLEYCFLNPSLDKLFKWQSTLDQATAASTGKFLGIRGFEWTSDVFGHINVYFSQNFTNAKTDGGYALTMQTFWDWFTRDPNTPGLAGSPSSPVPFGGGADGLAHFNHPHDKCLLKSAPLPPVAGECDWNDFTLIPAAEPRMFGIEAFNDSNRDDRYQPYLAKALDNGWHLSFIGSEDEHFGQYAVEFRPKTVTLAKGLDADDFKEAWLARRTYALTPGQHLRAEQLADGAHPMGSRLSCDVNAKTVPLEVSLKNPDGSAFKGEFQLYTNGGQMLSRTSGTAARFALPIEAGKERWYFVRVHGPDGKSVAYLAPVWVTGK